MPTVVHPNNLPPMDENNGSSDKPKLKLTRPDKPKPAPAEPPEAPSAPAEASPDNSGKAFAPILKRPTPKPPADPAPSETPAPPAPSAEASPPVEPPPPPPPVTVSTPPASPAPTPEPLPEAVTAPADREPIEEPQERRGPWLSILVIAALLFLLTGSGLGIWWVLRSPGAEPSSTSTLKTPAEPANKGPIGKAREAIAAAEENAVPAKLLESGQPAEAKPVAAPAPEAVAGTGPEPAQASGVPDVAANTEAVTRYLESAFIGAVGGVASNPRAMIDGKNYMKGDIVNESLGLRFINVDGGTLYFKDSNDVIYVKRF